jgi:catechol 2,3-dioxygenase-like lactoylglutathione lyase family enzyme
MKNIIALNHVSLLVKDTARALQFYQELLGLELDESRPQMTFPGAWLVVGAAQIHLLEISAAAAQADAPEHGGRDRHFPIKTHLEFKQDSFDHRTVMELVTADRPGLLSQIGRAFTACGVKLLNAKIATLGSRVEDVYYITDKNNEPLTDTLISECLEKAIYKYLDIDNVAASGDFNQ